MLRKVLTVNALDFVLPLKRAGVAHHIENFTTAESLKNFEEQARQRHILQA
jgi:hypothetical protein